ncbi:MAG: hypothetical protein WBQ73_01565 [Candidatus Babeliales bacterium]
MVVCLSQQVPLVAAVVKYSDTFYEPSLWINANWIGTLNRKKEQVGNVLNKYDQLYLRVIDRLLMVKNGQSVAEVEDCPLNCELFNPKYYFIVHEYCSCELVGSQFGLKKLFGTFGLIFSNFFETATLQDYVTLRTSLKLLVDCARDNNKVEIEKIFVKILNQLLMDISIEVGKDLITKKIKKIKRKRMWLNDPELRNIQFGRSIHIWNDEDEVVESEQLNAQDVRDCFDQQGLFNEWVERHYEYKLDNYFFTTYLYKSCEQVLMPYQDYVLREGQCFMRKAWRRFYYDNSIEENGSSRMNYWALLWQASDIYNYYTYFNCLNSDNVKNSDKDPDDALRAWPLIRLACDQEFVNQVSDRCQYKGCMKKSVLRKCPEHMLVDTQLK